MPAADIAELERQVLKAMPDAVMRVWKAMGHAPFWEIGEESNISVSCAWRPDVKRRKR